MKRRFVFGSLALGLLLQPAALAGKGSPMQPPTITGNPAAHIGEQVQIYGTLAPQRQPVARESRLVYLAVDDASEITVDVPKAFAGCSAAVSFTGQVQQAKDGPPYQLKATAWECISPGSPADWLHSLGLASVSLEHKQDALDRLSGLGEAGVPLLIGHIRDERLYGQRMLIPGAAINAPANAPAPQPTMVTIPVGQVCQDLLYSMLTPEYVSPYAGNFKPYSSSLFLVRDWPAWWQRQRGRSLSEIRKALEPRVDAYWRSHGTVQVLDEE